MNLTAMTKDPDARAGLLLIVATILALIASNSPLADVYNRLLAVKVSISVDQCRSVAAGQTAAALDQ